MGKQVNKEIREFIFISYLLYKFKAFCLFTNEERKQSPEVSLEICIL